MSKTESSKDIYQKYLKYKKKYYDLVKKRLKKSLYSHQGRDFFFLTIPKGHPNAGREIPVDYQLRNLVVYFWGRGFITMGWDQGIWDYPGFISFGKETIQNDNTLTVLKELLYDKFGKNNVIIEDDSDMIWESEEDAINGIKYINEQDKLFFGIFPNKLRIIVETNSVRLVFKNSYLSEIYQKLGLKLYPFDERCPGGLI